MERKKAPTGERKTVNVKRKSIGDPNFLSMFKTGDLPGLPKRDIEDMEQNVNVEMEDIFASIRKNRKNNAERFRDVESGEFWFCVCFQSRSQKEKFIADLLAKYAPHTRNFGDKYVSGLELAEMLDIPVEPIILEVKKNRLAPKNLRETEVI